MNYYTGYLGKWHSWEHTPGWGGKTDVGWVLTRKFIALIEVNISIASIEVTSNDEVNGEMVGYNDIDDE